MPWVAIPSFFGFCYEWGFITYLLAISIGILFFIQNIQYRNLFKSTIYTPLSTYITIQNSIQNTIKIEPIRNSNIETFIKNLVEDTDSFEILMKV